MTGNNIIVVFHYFYMYTILFSVQVVGQYHGQSPIVINSVFPQLALPTYSGFKQPTWSFNLAFTWSWLYMVLHGL